MLLFWSVQIYYLILDKPAPLIYLDVLDSPLHDHLSSPLGEALFRVSYLQGNQWYSFSLI